MVLTGAIHADLAAQNGPTPQASPIRLETARIATAPVTSQKPTIDGRLDELVWRNVAPITGFVQRELHEGDPVTERTEVRIITDAEAIYVGAWMFDREPQSIVPGEKIRDVSLDNSDYVALIFDTYLDRQNGFVFATTPAGIEYDGQVAKEGEGGGVQTTGQSRAAAGSLGGFNINWDGNWTVRTSRDSLGWYAEFRIPYSTLRYAGGSRQAWGLNVGRGIRRKGEDAYWAFIPRQFSIYRLSRAGTVELAQIPTQRLTTFTPYLLGGKERTFATSTTAKSTTETGFDAKYGVTPSMTLDLTYNTDFAQVEVDEQRTNLTRFPLFFPEKRPFFLENAGTFSAGTPQSVDLFFSRRIGIDTLGRAVPIRGGGRLSGRVAGLNVGALEIVTNKAELFDGTANRFVPVQPANAYSVARVTRELPNRSRLGVIGVNRMAIDSTSNRNSTFAVDGRMGIGEAVTLDGWGARTATPRRTGDQFAYSFRAAYQTAEWNHGIRVVQTGEDFNPEVGFLTRAGGFRYYEATTQRFVRNPELKWLKDWNPHVSFRNYYKPDGYFQSGWLHMDLTELEFADGGKFGPEYNLYHEGLQQPFEIAPGVVLPVGGYHFGTVGLDWTSNPSAPLNVLVRGDFGPFYNGTRNGGSATLTFRHGASVSTSLLVDYNNVRLEQGDFERKLIGARIAYFFTPRIFLQSLTQYSNQSQIWSANARFGWLSTAGTGLFVVFNDGENADSFFSWRQPQSRSLLIKYARQFGTGN
jgi:hypothetical protein